MSEPVLTTSAARMIAAILRNKLTPDIYAATLVHLADAEQEARLTTLLQIKEQVAALPVFTVEPGWAQNDAVANDRNQVLALLDQVIEEAK